MTDMDIKYTEEQQKVIDSNAKRMMVVSCAGSGKSTTIVGRVIRLIGSGVPAGSIVLLTFSNKAAADLRYKFNDFSGCDGLTIATFHAFGLDIIKKNLEILGFKAGIGIVGDGERKSIVSEIIEKFKAADKLAGKFEWYNDAEMYVKYIAEKKCGEREVERRFGEVNRRRELFGLYNDELKNRNMLDMEDLIYLPLRLFEENANIKTSIRDSIRYLFVDEYQDTNTVQNEFIDALTSKDTSVCLVGDDDQAIYEWRGAKPEYIREKALSSSYKVFKLQENFRSQKGIIEIANRLIGNNKIRVKKEVRPMRAAEPGPYFKRFMSEADEAKYIAATISKLVRSKKFNYKDIAILVRKSAQLDAIKGALEKEDIRYEENLLRAGYEYSKFVAVLKAIAEWNAYEKIVAAANFPDRCFDKYVLEDAKDAYNAATGNTTEFSNMEWLDRIYKSEGVEYDEFCEKFRERYEVLIKLRMAKGLSAKQIIAFLIEKYYPNYAELMNKSKQTEEFQYVMQTFEIASMFESAMGPQYLGDFLIQLGQAVGSEEYNVTSGANSVKLMTIHRSKGLEYKVVFVVGVQVGVFPNDYFIRGEEDVEAERRLFYVAITRAKNLLFLSSTDDPCAGSNDNKKRALVPHGFIAEIPTVLNASKAFSPADLNGYPECESLDGANEIAERVRSSVPDSMCAIIKTTKNAPAP